MPGRTSSEYEPEFGMPLTEDDANIPTMAQISLGFGQGIEDRMQN